MSEDVHPPARRFDTEHELSRRLDTVERNLTDHSKTITGIVDGFGDVRRRLSDLETVNQDRRVYDAGKTARDEALQDDISQMKEDIKSIKGVFTKALWVFLSAILVAFATFVVRGGLS